VHLAERDHLALEEEGERPVDDDTDLAIQRGDPPQVVRAMHEPGEEAGDLQAVHLGDALV
jgi:hypothetical protein